MATVASPLRWSTGLSTSPIPVSRVPISSGLAPSVHDPAGSGRMSAHGTHVASLIFGQPGSQIPGIAPRCRGLIVPVFRDFQEGHLPQLDLARAIEQAVQLGADVISVSGGERSQDGQADTMLARALQRCDESNVLVVAAAGNDGCDCLHVPAAVPSVLAVGALGKDGEPLAMSNWGEAYRSHGVLAPGQEILGAAPGGGTAARTGSSFATPLVAGVAALLDEHSTPHRGQDRCPSRRQGNRRRRGRLPSTGRPRVPPLSRWSPERPGSTRPNQKGW